MALHFTKEEFSNRKQNVLKSMEEQNLDALLMFRQESMYWLTGYDTFGYVFFQTLILNKNGNITEIGELVSKFGNHRPELSKMLLMSIFYNCENDIAILVSMLESFQYGNMKERFTINQMSTDEDKKQSLFKVVNKDKNCNN